MAVYSVGEILSPLSFPNNNTQHCNAIDTSQSWQSFMIKGRGGLGNYN
jgi:hypothetical protein